MRRLFLLGLACLLPAPGVADEITVRGLVYDRTKILEWKDGPPPAPEEVGVPDAIVALTGATAAGSRSCS